MKLNLKLVRIGMNMEDATIVKWHKDLGERFAAGEAIYEIETEKGEVAAVGDVICGVELAD